MKKELPRGSEQPIFKKTIKHLADNLQKYILLVLLFILLMPLATNLFNHKPIIMSEESYYHLNQARNITGNNFYYIFLNIMEENLPLWSLLALVYVLNISSCLMLIRFSKEINNSNLFAFFFVLFIILSPTIIFNSIRLSANMFFLFLVLTGFTLALHKKQRINNFSIIPFTAAMFIDIASTLILAVMLYLFLYKRKEKLIKQLFIIMAAILLINMSVLNQDFFFGPFHQQDLISDFISDLGGAGGVSIFILMLAIIGVKKIWNEKNLRITYIFLSLFLALYIYDTRAIFFLTFPLVFLATFGFMSLLKGSFSTTGKSSIMIKKFTLLLIILGILFSSVTYISRVSELSPTADEKETLLWIRDNSNHDSIIYSTPENLHQISYFAERRAFSSFDKKNKETSLNILSSTYISDLFPLLEDNQINIIYLNKKIKEQLPKDQGLLFLLKNERFKLLYSTNTTEAWEFSQD